MTFADKVAGLEQLQNQVSGSIVTPDHADYEHARLSHNLALDQHPALILIAQNAEDVVAGVRFAREAGLNIGIQSTGHGMHIPVDNSLLIITSQMKAVQVDVKNQTARVEAGARWENVLAESTPHGLAPLLGSSPHVGVVGYTLGGGIGWLARRYGYAADSVRWIDIVTADGVLRRASPAENSDLFWGLRGGGGNFGVVTALEFNLYPVASLYGGNLFYPAESAADALRFFRDWVKTVPDEMTSSIAVMKFPSLPMVPAELRGKIEVIFRAAYTGDVDEGAAYIQKWIDWQTPLNNTFRQMPFSEVATISNDPTTPAPVYGSNEMLNDLSDEAVEVIIRYVTNPASPMAMVDIRHAGGAIAKVAPDANAIGSRDAQMFLQMGGIIPTPEVEANMRAYVAEFRAALRPYRHGGAYLNFMVGAEACHRAKEAYLPETLQRLIALKSKYDPDNRFRFSYQFTPAE